MEKKKEIDTRLVPEVNIGTVGHVDHGKSTLVEALTGKWPASHSEELKRGITIKLGYADATIYKCAGKEPHYTTKDRCLTHACECEPQRTVSFVDAPGHETLMATVIAGASLMDGALLVIAANEKCPQPQTREHLMTLEISGIKNIIIVQNKIDLVSEEKALENYGQIKEFVKGTVADNSPVIPVSAQSRINLDALMDSIQKNIPTPKREGAPDPKMYVVRSFDVNKPGTEINKLEGGIIGGALLKGTLKVGDELEILPGIKTENRWRGLKTKVISLQKAGMDLEEASPGGLLGLKTSLDPGLTKSDNLAGNIAGLPGKLPQLTNKIKIKVNLFTSLVGGGKVNPLIIGENLLINIGTGRSLGAVKNSKKGTFEIDLKIPMCAGLGERAVLSRRISDRWRLIGWGAVA